MPATRELRRRIRSVKSTKQITKAMELVSASKMRRASSATQASRPYSQHAEQVLTNLLSGPVTHAHPLLTTRPVERIAIVAIASDRGLAGVYNAGIFKKALAFHKECADKKVSFITLGSKLERSLIRSGLSIVQSYPHSNTQARSADIVPLSLSLINSFTQGEYDQVWLIYTHFASMLRQEVVLKPLLPLQAPPTASTSEFLYEPSPTEVLDTLLPRLVEVTLYQALLESLASEHSARRLAMKNATDNATDMIDDLTLTFNGLRQSAITQEIAEITSGAAALTT